MSILSTNNKLIKVGQEYSAGSGISIDNYVISVSGEFGQTYSAGDNIGIYTQYNQLYISGKDWEQDIANASSNAYNAATAQIPAPQDLSYLSGRIDTNTSGIDYISSVCLTAHKDWTDTIKGASSYSYEQSTSYFDKWISGQYTGDITNITNNITALSGDFGDYYKKTETSSKDEINDALQYVSANAGKVYEGVSPIVVNNVEDKISADTWTFSAGSNVSFVDDNVNKITRIDCTVTGEGGDPQVNSFVYNNSATIVDVDNSYKANSGSFLTAAPANMATKGDVAELAQTISETYQVKGDYATVENVKSATSGKADTSGVIDYFNKPVEIGGYESVWASGGKLHAGYTAEAAYLYAYGNSENFTEVSPTQIWTKSGNKKTIDIQKLSATSNGFAAAGIEIGQSKVEISGGDYYGVQFRTPNTAMASAGLYYSANDNVPRAAPVFSAKNASGDGFSIWAGGAKGFDASGNTIWDVTAPAKLIGWSNYQGTVLDPRSIGIDGSIVATVYPDQIPTGMAISSAPYSYMNGGGLYACSQGGTKLSVDAQQRSITVVVPSLSSTAQMNHADVSYTKYNTTISANEIWSLTGSVQKREIEYDANTSAITAIAGSAIGGGGVTGEFVPQSAFDELKASYDALSSLFATYSGQWLLPNEGV